MRKKSAGGVLARHCRLTVSAASANMTLIILRVADLATALLDGLFAHPAGYSDTDTARELIATYDAKNEFFRSLLGSPFTLQRHVTKLRIDLHQSRIFDAIGHRNRQQTEGDHDHPHTGHADTQQHAPQ